MTKKMNHFLNSGSKIAIFLMHFNKNENNFQVVAEAESSEAFYENSQIHYGLFSGYLTRFIFTTSPYYHKLTSNYGIIDCTAM